MHMKASSQLAVWTALASLTVLGCSHSRLRPPAIAAAPASPAATSDQAEAPLPAAEPDLLAVPPDQLGSSSFDAAREGEGPLADILFDFDQATLTESARATLAEHATWLRAHRFGQLIIEGHCDERGTDDYNLVLGSRRAEAAGDYLSRLGVEATLIKTVSLGKERPLDPAHTENAWARNRRAHFVVKGPS